MRVSRALIFAMLSSCGSPSAALVSSDSANHHPPDAANVESAANAAAASSEAAKPVSPTALGSDVAIPKVVLHTGDSMVGYYAGLEKALGPRFEALGSKYVQDAITSAAIVTFDKNDHFAKMLATRDPDLVLITLGANDVFLPSPQRLAKNVASIAKKTEGRKCFWMSPPLWKKDTGIVDVIRQNCAPCVFFDSSTLKLERRADGIHPDDKGGETWANAFWDFYRTQPGAPSAAVDVPLLASPAASAVKER